MLLNKKVMDNKNEIKDELKKISPFLSKIKKEDAFKVPENYFQSLPDQILEQIRDNKNLFEKERSQVTWPDQLMKYIAVLFQPKVAATFATVVALILAAVYFSQKPTDQLDGTDQSVTNYVAENIDEFDAEMLWETSIYEFEENNPNDKLQETNFDEFFEEIIYELDDSELEQLL